MSWMSKLGYNLNVVEEAFDQFDDIAANTNIEDVEIGTSANYQEINDTAKILNLLMAAVIPFLMCSAYVVCLKIVSMLIEIRSISILQPALDPETLNPKKKKISNCCQTILKLFLINIMLGLVVESALMHLEVIHRWGEISDKDDFFAEKIVALKEKVDETFDISDKNMHDFGFIKSKAMDELPYAPEYTQDLIVSKIDKVLEKGEAFAVRSEKIDNLYKDLENKILATEFSFCFITSSIISTWFWLHIICNQMKHRLLLFFITAISCIIFLTCAFTAMYVSLVQSYVLDFIHPGSEFIKRTMLEIVQELGKIVWDNLHFPTVLGLSS